MKTYLLKKILGITLCAVLATIVHAQDVDSSDSVSIPLGQATQAPVRVFVSAGASHQADADLDSGGSFSLSRFKISAALPLQVDEESVLRSSVSYDFASYDFSGAAGLWDDIHTLAAVSLYEWNGNGPWSYYGGGLVRASAEAGADLGGATTAGGLIGANYAYDETLTFGAGLAALSQIEDSAMLLPLITANWKFADDWRLKLGMSDLATAGYGLAAIWDIDEQLALTFGVQVHKSRFRIDGEGPTNDGVGQERSSLLYAAATWRATPTVALDGYVGIAGGGELRVENSQGDKIAETDYDPALVLGVKVSVRL